LPDDLNSSAPTVRTQRLSNGLEVVALQNRAAPVVALQIWVDVGSADERDEQGGLAHVHEHMLFKGTKRRAVGQIAAEIEAAGGDINAWTSLDGTVYHVVMATRFLDTGLDILADAILNSSFDPDELSRELEVILEEIKRGEDSPQSRVSHALFSTAYTTHPYKRPVIGHADVVREFSREQILDFYGSHYRPDRLTVVAVGDFDPQELMPRIERAFASAEGRAGVLPARAVEPPQTAMRGAGLIADIEETQLAVGWHGPSIQAADLCAVDVMTVLFGAGESSRLVHHLKRERQLVNETYAYAYTPRDAGLIVCGASLEHERLAPTLRALGNEVRRLKERGASAEELTKAKTMLRSDAVYQRETVEGMARRLGYWRSMVGDPNHEDQYQADVEAVTAEDIVRVARRYLTAETANVIALAPKGQEAFVEPAALMEPLAEGLRGPAPRSRATASGPRLHEIEGGARVIVVPDRNNPIVSVRSVWLGGLRAETDETAGASNLIGDMLVKGTSLLSASEVARAIDGMAAHIGGVTGRNTIGARATFLADDFDEGAELFAACLTDPAFADDELERVRRIALLDIKNRADHAAGLCFELFNKALWREHPYRRDMLGTTEAVTGASSEGLRRFYRDAVVRDGAVLSIVGDVDETRALDALEDIVRRLPAKAEERSWPTEEKPVDAPRIVRRVRDKAQAHLVLGYRGLRLNDDQRPAMELLCSVLAGQGGRLFLELRDKQSLCYSVSAFSVEGIEPGSFAVYMGTSPEKVDQALAGIETLLGDLVAEGPTESELSRGQRYLLGSHDIGLQRLGARAATMALHELYGLGWEFHKRYAERIEGVTREDVRALAEQLLVPAGRVTSVVGPEGTGGPASNFDVDD